MTNASPFVLPPGAAVVQTNLMANVPGKLETRGGMRSVQFVTTPTGFLDCFSATRGGREYMVTLADDGSLLVLESPAYGATQVPVEPSLTVSGSTVSSSYTFRYLDGTLNGSSADPSPPPLPPPPPPTPPTPEPPTPPPVGLVSWIDGGSSTSAQEYSLNAMSAYGTATELSLTGGTAGMGSFVPTLLITQLQPLV